MLSVPGYPCSCRLLSSSLVIGMYDFLPWSPFAGKLSKSFLIDVCAEQSKASKQWIRAIDQNVTALRCQVAYMTWAFSMHTFLLVAVTTPSMQHRPARLTLVAWWWQTWRLIITTWHWLIISMLSTIMYVASAAACISSAVNYTRW